MDLEEIISILAEINEMEKKTQNNAKNQKTESFLWKDEHDWQTLAKLIKSKKRFQVSKTRD